MNGAIEYPGRELEVMAIAQNYHRWILDEFGPYLGQVVVEVGAGTGDLSKLLLDRGPRHLYSFEPASNLFPKLQSNLERVANATPVNGFLDAAALPEPPDSVIYVNVLEHIEDDAGELRRVRQILKPGGTLLIFVPALSWLYSQADRRMGHFRRYHMKDLLRIVEAAGFQTKQARYFDLAGVLPWFVYVRLMRGSLIYSQQIH